MDTICIKPQKKFLAIFSLLFSIFILSSSKTSAASDGQKIFKQNCAVCHSLGANKITGPGFAGVASRVPGDAWMMKWIKSNTAVLASGDPYAKKIFAENNGAQMTVFNDLSDDDIKAVIAYIK